MGHLLTRLSVVLLLASCRPSAADPRPTVAPTASPAAPSASPPPSSSTSTSTPSTPPADPLCDRVVTELDGKHHDYPPPTLTDVAPTIQLVAVVVPVLDAPDCSGVGWRHLAFEPFDAAHTEGLIRAYRSMPLHAPAPDDAPFYLMGGTIEAARDVDLKKVCVAFKSTVNVRADWVVPLRDRAEAQAWNERLSRKFCGRNRPGCRGCENNCGHAPGCCHTVEDSCPGERGRYSTCIGFVPCDAFCCE
jgi:hypothetical protein